MADSPLPPEFRQHVTLTCKANVGGEILYVQIQVLRAVYDDPGVREHIEGAIRLDLMAKILEKWTPVIRVS